MRWIDRDKLPHDVPHWIDPSQEAFFITINCRQRSLNQLAYPDVWQGIRDAIEFREQRGDWKWPIFLAMPDHFHGIVTFPKTFYLRKNIREWKRWTARNHRIHWQEGFFDHRLRSGENASSTADYIRQNPVRAGLATLPEEWPYRRDWRDA